MKIFLSVLTVMFSASAFSADSVRKKDGSLKTKFATLYTMETVNA